MSCNGACRECSFLTCSFHPLFHLTGQYLKRFAPGRPGGAKR